MRNVLFPLWIISILICFLFSTAPAQPADTLWTATIGGNGDYLLRDAALTQTGDAICIGRYQVGHGGPYYNFIGQVSADGDCTWTHIYDDAPGCEVRAILPEPDGSVAMAGLCWNEVEAAALFRTNTAGNLQWYRSLPVVGERDAAYAICHSPDGGYVLCGNGDRDFMVGGDDLTVSKTDSAGNTIWTTGHQPVPWTLNHGNRVIPVRAGGYAALGYTQQGDSPFDWNFLLVRLSEQGDTVWTHTYGAADTNETGTALLETDDGGLLLVGNAAPSSSPWDGIEVYRVDASGTVVWERRYFGGSGFDLSTYDVIPNPLGGWVLAGGRANPSTGDYLLIGISSTGDSLWSTYYPTQTSGYASRVFRTNDGGYLLIGSMYQDMDPQSVYIVRTSQENIADYGRAVPNKSALLSAYPNPFNPTTVVSFDIPRSSRITLSVYDLTGRLVETLADKVYPKGNHQVSFEGENLPSGIYFARLHGAGFAKTQKLVLLK